MRFREILGRWVLEGRWDLLAMRASKDNKDLKVIVSRWLEVISTAVRETRTDGHERRDWSPGPPGPTRKLEWQRGRKGPTGARGHRGPSGKTIVGPRGPEGHMVV
eukprot:738348-Hanusia_phi.AAC.2